MEQDNPNESLRKTLEQLGYTEGKVSITITKEITVERMPTTLTMQLEECFPYPLLTDSPDNCHICGEPLKNHKHMDYFINPAHIKAIRNFLMFLMEKHDETKNMYLKLGIEAPDSVLTPKEMVLLLKELAQTNPALANRLVAIYPHYIPSESFKYQIEVGVSRKLMEIETHYEGTARKWQTEFLIHKSLAPKQLESEEEEITKKALGTNQTEGLYKQFLAVHEEDAKIDYVMVQSDFHRVTSRILAYEKLMKQFSEMPRFGKLKRAFKDRAERPIYLPTYPGYGFPTRRRRQPMP